MYIFRRSKISECKIDLSSKCVFISLKLLENVFPLASVIPAGLLIVPGDALSVHVGNEEDDAEHEA